jgi:vancomycin resistance protein VanW
MAVGKEYFTARRHIAWLWARDLRARHRELGNAIVQFRHASPILRELRDVDMALQRNKATNLRLASARLDGLVLAPGEVLSFWREIGRPTRRKGYLKGMILVSGTVQSGIGGGLCQLSNLLYWMTVHTPLTVVERHRHNYDVFPDASRVVPFGGGATCFYNYGDLVLRNDTVRPFRLQIGIEGEELVGCWLSTVAPEYTYEVYEKSHIIRVEEWGGYTRHNLLFRRVYNQAGAQMGEEFVVENHAIMMYSPLLPPGSGEGATQRG